MGKLIDLRGNRVGRLTIVDRADSIKSPCGTVKAVWNCICDCGKTVSVRSGSLINGHTLSCGCLVVETSRALRIKETRHGHSRLGKVTPTYQTWRAMMGRCLNAQHKDFPRYGARGILVCQSWEIFDNFLMDMGARPHGTTLDRIDGEGNYELANCRWGTPHQQSQNQSTTKLNPLKIRNIRKDQRTNCEIAATYGVSASSISNIRLGKSWKNI